MPLTPEDVRSKQFSASGLGRKGYEAQEVRGFLAEVASELDGLVSARAELASRLEATQQALIAVQPRAGGTAPEEAPAPDAPEAPAPAAPEAPAPAAPEAPAPDAHVPDAQVPTDDVAVRAARVLALAERTAEEHVSQARAEADQLLGTARQRAATVDQETDERQRRVIGAIEAQRAELEQRIESLRSFEREYRSRLSAYLQQQLSELHAGGSTDGSTPTATGSVDVRRPVEDPSPS